MRSIFSSALFCASTFVFAQLNMSIVGQLDYQDLHDSDISDVWGYVDGTGIEYALVGVNNGGVSVVSLADPTSPQEVFYFPGANTIWRDLKVWNDHAYITNEGDNGLTIIDLSPLPFSNALTAANWQEGGWTSAHNIYIDENGIAYISGANRGNGGVIFLDLTVDPFQPVEVGEFDQWYSHDCMTRGDTMYAAHISDGWFSIVDVSDKQNPVLLGTRNTGNNFTHNCWVSDNGQYLFTTDEVVGGWLGSYDISDPTDIQELQLWRSDPGSGTIPHNTHFINDYVVTSYYRIGTTIHDVSRPWNVVEVGRYDHCDLVGEGFNGGWGTYPWLPSGRIISTDIEEGLIVLDATYVRACWLEGTIRNAQTTAPVVNATLQIVGIVTAAPTTFNGAYATGHHAGGTYEVFVSAPGYESATVTGVVLQTGEVTLLDIDLVPLVSFALQGIVVEAGTGAPIEGAQVTVKNDIYDHQAVTASDGTFNLPAVFADNYDVVAGRWGWRTECPAEQAIDAATGMLTITLEPGYYDDFIFDFGWTVSSTADVGMWERGAPIGTTFQGDWVNPPSDIANDCGDQAYVTGNGGGAAGNDDVDGGNTILTSPIFDGTTVWDPHVRYQRWFFNAGGSGAPNDRMTITLDNGITTAVLENITVSGSSSSWVPRDHRILDHLERTTTMQLIVFVTDDEPGHLVEGGFDGFEVVEMSPMGMELVDESQPFTLWPNPSDGRFEVRMALQEDAILEVFDALGRSVRAPERTFQGYGTFHAELPPGTYVVRITTDGGSRMTQLLSVGR